MYEAPPPQSSQGLSWAGVRRRLLHPPRRRALDWLNLALGLLLSTLSLLHGVLMIWTLLGISYTLGGLAELLPRAARRPAAALRAGSWLLGIATMLLIVGAMVGLRPF